MNPEELALSLLNHAKWMVASGQCRMTVRGYLECLRSYPARDGALRLLGEEEAADTAGGEAGGEERG